MDERIIQYLKKRIESFSNNHRGITVNLTLTRPERLEIVTGASLDSDSTAERFEDIRLKDQTLGSLRLSHPSAQIFSNPQLTQDFKAFALQMAALLDNSDVWVGVQLDRAMETLFASHPRFQWCGVYRLKNDELRLSAFRGETTPHAVIDPNQGLCGAAVRENQTLNIADVSADDRYLACDLKTRAEVVVPIRNRAGEAIAEIDIDSHSAGAFDDDELRKLEELASELASVMLK